MDDEAIIESSYEWVRTNKKALIEKFARLDDYETDVKLISLFMAGSPGAGKTEISKRLAEQFTKKPVIIDADEIRKICPQYEGANAHLFQKAATKGVHILYDYVLAKNINVIVDGTFAYAQARENIRRSIERGRKIEIYFVYQDPLQAWEFTKKREALEHRHISKEVFIKGFFDSQRNVTTVKNEFGNAIELNIIIKNNDNSIEKFYLNKERLDPYIKNVYSADDLEKILL